jgi:hypothetical protein
MDILFNSTIILRWCAGDTSYFQIRQHEDQLGTTVRYTTPKKTQVGNFREWLSLQNMTCDAISSVRSVSTYGQEQTFKITMTTELS